ncbi:hypothetical protein E2C01_020424 [Portunus trituberculatus]|uniref:Uncharacterized protein n=1 Tax=Portunus trituberculatus TaxID=210409 RepID=A0A5B7E290_PORTR|nr:hypothetical protein [Portunus trituberculatus]
MAARSCVGCKRWLPDEALESHSHCVSCRPAMCSAKDRCSECSHLSLLQFQAYVKDAEKRSAKEKKRAKSSGGSSEKRSHRRSVNIFTGLGIFGQPALGCWFQMSCPPHTLSKWICQAIQRAYVSVSEEESRLLKVNAHEVQAIATNVLFRKVKSLDLVLKAGTWKSMSTFASFYLRDVTHR